LPVIHHCIKITDSYLETLAPALDPVIQMIFE
jgi:hypothetical protein